MLLRGIRFLHNWSKRLLKISRSFYYFRKGTVFVHGRVYIGVRKNIRIGDGCSINRGVIIQGFNDVRIGRGVVLSVNCMILDGNLDYARLVETGRREHIPGHVHIGDYVWIGAGAIILPGVSIGSRSVVGAGSVVNGSFPEDVLIVGNPAKVIRKLAKGMADEVDAMKRAMESAL